MMKLLYKAMLILIFSSVSFALFAQEPESVKDKVETLKKIKLIEKLRLSEQQSLTFFARYDEQGRKIEEVRLSIQQSVRDLDQTIKEGKTSEYSSKIEILFKKESQLHALIIERVKNMKSILSEEQYARYVIFEHKFLADLKKEVIKRRKK